MSNAVTVPADKLAELQREAARYRWLRTRRDVTLITMFFGNGCVNKTIEMAEAEMDKAMAADGVDVPVPPSTKPMPFDEAAVFTLSERHRVLGTTNDLLAFARGILAAHGHGVGEVPNAG